jgi:Fe-S cluster assembly protein SufB
MTATEQDVRSLLRDRSYKAGFVTELESDTVAPGLSEDTIRFISAKKNEPDWLLAWRLKAFARWSAMREPSARSPPRCRLSA